MARYGRPQEFPAWLRDKSLIEAEPEDVAFDRGTTQKFLMVCAVSGATTSLVLVRWRAHNLRQAEITFQNWLDNGWGILSTSPFNVPGRWVFRTGAVTGFTALEDQR